MASSAPPADLTAVYRAGLANTVATALNALGQLWRNLYNPLQPLGSLATIGQGAAIWTTAAQRAAADQAEAYLEASYARMAGIPRAAVEPFARNTGLAGTSAAGRPLAEMTGQAPAVYLNRLAGGWSEEDAAASSAAWLNRLTASEPYRVANETITSAAELDDRLAKRFVRITAPGACAFCLLIRDRGYTAANVGFAAHANCRCTAGPEIELGGAGRERDARPDWQKELDELRKDGVDYDELKRIGATIDDEVRRRLGGVWADDPDFYSTATDMRRAMYHQEMWKVLGEYRSFGGTLELETKRSPGIARLRAETGYYPTDWLNASNDYWRSLSVSTGAGRGSYSAGAGKINLSNRPTVAVHELFHRMEHVNSAIRAAEYQFWLERQALTPGGEKLSTIYAGTSERGIKDKFADHYQGRTYGTPGGGNFWELGSTGMEALAYDVSQMRLDADYLRFMLGVLGGL